MNHCFPAAVLTVVALTLGACGSSDNQDSKAEVPESMNVKGALLVPNPDGEPSEPCSLSSGYSDLEGGSQVTVYGADGTILDVGHTDEGEFKVFQSKHVCAFHFSLTDVPAKDDLYSIEVGHRGRINFKKVNSELLVLSLGS